MYLEEVRSRHCLAASVATHLSRERAAQMLLAAHQQLIARGLGEPRLVQSDGGSDFTSNHFQQMYDDIDAWIRCRVAQVGGMGILKRLKRTFKHDDIFRHEVNTQNELKALILLFLKWYNEQRLHSSLGYRRPAMVLAEEAAVILS